MPRPLRPEDIQNLFRDLFKFPPQVMTVGGLLLSLAGAAICIWGWDKGLLFQAHGVLAVAGLPLMLLGLANGSKRRDVERQVRLLEGRGDEMLAKLAELKKKGGATLSYMIEQGITDVRLQGLLLKHASEG